MLAVPLFLPQAVVAAALPMQQAAPVTGPVVAPVIASGLVFVLTVAGAVGLILLLPGRREAAIQKMGAALLIAVAVIFGAVLAKAAAGMNAYFWIFSAIAVVSAVRVVTHAKPVYSALYFVLTVMASAGLFVLMWAEFMAAALVIIYAGAILVTYVFVIMLASQSTPAGATSMGQQLTDHDANSREPVMASAVGFALLGLLLFVIFDKGVDIQRSQSGDVTAALNQLLNNKDITSEVFTDPTTQPSAEKNPISRENFSSSKSVSYSFSEPVTAVATIAPASAPSQDKFVPVGGTQELGEYLFRNQLVNLELAGLILTVAMVGAIVIARKRVVGGIAYDESAGERLTAPATPVDDNPHSIPVVGTDNPRQKEYPQT